MTIRPTQWLWRFIGLLATPALLLLLAACGGTIASPDAADSTPLPVAGTATEAPARSPSPTASTEPEPTADPEPDVVEASSSPAPSVPAPASPSASPQPQSPAPSSTRGHTRGAWVHLFDGTLKTRSGIDRLLAESMDTGIDTLIIQVARRHDAYYRSDVLPRTPDPQLSADLDVLDYVLRKAQPAGIEVEAWITVAPTYHHAYDGLIHPQGWLWTDHGTGAPEAERWVTRHLDGRWGDYLDPSLPEVVTHVTAVAVEIATRYPIDGIHLDYVRYPGNEWGYHPRVLERFRAETGRTDTPAPTDTQWSAWRRSQVTNLASQVTRAVHDVRPEVRISAATIAWGEGPRPGRSFSETRTYREVLQDWPQWVADGTLDAVYPMLYFRADQHAAWFDQWLTFTAQTARSGKATVAAGVGAYLSTPTAAVDQIRRAERDVGGVVVYSWQQPSSGDRAATIQSLRAIWAD